MRIAYQYHHLNEAAKQTAAKARKGTLLTQWLYNKNGTEYKTSTTVQL